MAGTSTTSDTAKKANQIHLFSVTFFRHHVMSGLHIPEPVEKEKNFKQALFFIYLF